MRRWWSRTSRARSANRRHAPPLGSDSCSPVDPASDYLTVGTPDANSRMSNFAGSVRYRVIVGDSSTPADVSIAVSITDVRNQGTLSDYTGELQSRNVARITDRNSGAGEAATRAGQHLPRDGPVHRHVRHDDRGRLLGQHHRRGRDARRRSSAGKRAIWELGQTEVLDGGADGLASTGPNTVFARQGVFAP